MVTCLYLSRHPDRASDFLEYHYVHEHKAMEHLAKTGLEAEKVLGPETAARIREDFERVRSRFTDTDCKKCGSTRLRQSWTKLDIPSMAREVGIGAVYPEMYFWPTLQIHTTVYRISQWFQETEDKIAFDGSKEPRAADNALIAARLCMMVLLEHQDQYFKLGLRDEILRLNEDYVQAKQGTPASGEAGPTPPASRTG